MFQAELQAIISRWGLASWKRELRLRPEEKPLSLLFACFCCRPEQTTKSADGRISKRMLNGVLGTTRQAGTIPSYLRTSAMAEEVCNHWPLERDINLVSSLKIRGRYKLKKRPHSYPSAARYRSNRSITQSPQSSQPRLCKTATTADKAGIAETYRSLRSVFWSAHASWRKEISLSDVFPENPLSIFKRSGASLMHQRRAFRRKQTMRELRHQEQDNGS